MGSPFEKNGEANVHVRLKGKIWLNHRNQELDNFSNGPFRNYKGAPLLHRGMGWVFNVSLKE